MRSWRTEGGATAVEYGIMVALIAVVIIAAVASVGRSTAANYTQVEDCIEAPVPCADDL